MHWRTPKALPSTGKRKKHDVQTGATNQSLYALRYTDGGEESLFKVGKTRNLIQRLRAYRTLIPNGTWFHTIECKDMHSSEKILHALLKRQGYHVQREIFRGQADTVCSLMDFVKELDQMMDKADRSKIDQVTAFLRKL